MRHLTAFAALVLFASSAASASVDLIVTPGTLSNDSFATAKADIATAPGLISLRAVFKEAEARFLREAGKTSLAQTLLASFDSETNADRFITHERTAFPGIQIEPRTEASLTDSPIEAQQWGIDNRGKKQPVSMDLINRVWVDGTPGEDIGIAKAPPENMDPAHRIVVAVLDTGIDYSHPDLQGRIFQHPSECEALHQYTECLRTGNKKDCDERFGKLDTDGNGYPLDCSGWDMTSGMDELNNILGDPDASDSVGHGTHVAGIIAAIGNGKGARGVAANVAILPVKVITTAPNSPIRPQYNSFQDPPPPREDELKEPRGFGDIIARGILYAIRSGAQVINMSLAWPKRADSKFMREMVDLALSRGIVIVASAGNDSNAAQVYPCHYDGVICVAAHGPDGALSHFSNYGSAVDIAAPGLDILSTWPINKTDDQYTRIYTERNGYELKSGTSMASPFVAGAVARLLNAGFSPQEIYPRLLLGARPHQVSKLDPPIPGAEKFTRSGNADVARSFQTTPEPLILPATKAPIFLRWKLQDASIPLAFALKNFWAAAGSVSIRAVIRSDDTSLTQSDWAISGWNPGETKEFSTTIQLQNLKLDGRLLLEITAQADSFSPRTFRIPIDISRTISVQTPEADLLALPLTGYPLLEKSYLTSVHALTDAKRQDYIAIQEGKDEWKLQLIAQKGDHYEVRAPSRLPGAHGNVLLAQRLDVNLDGADEYVILFQLPAPSKTEPQPFQFQFLDQDLRPLALFYDDAVGPRSTLYNDNKTTVVAQRFSWLRMTFGKRSLLLPAWIDYGFTPPAELPPSDPWLTAKEQEDQKSWRLYYLWQDGLHSIAPPDGENWIQLLSVNDADRAQGRLAALTATGADYGLDYNEVTLDGSRIKKSHPLQMDDFRNLVGFPGNMSVTPLGAADEAEGGSVCAGPGVRGGFETTFFSGGTATTYRFGTLHLLDTVMQIPGAFAGKDRTALFAQTHYDLEYRDLKSGQAATTSLNRFSFLPRYISNMNFYPTVTEQTEAPHEERLGSILIPFARNDVDQMEVIVPRYDLGGKLQALVRPARLRLNVPEGCMPILNPVPPTASAPTEAAFFCGDKFLRVKFQY